LILTALFLSWFYSAPPLRLHSRGLGELTIAVVVAGLTPLVGFYLQAGRLALLPFLAVLPLGALQFAQALAIEIPDREGDAAVGKRTLVVRLGRARSARLLIAAMAMAYLSVPILVLLGLPPLVALAVLLPLPLAAWQAWRLAGGAWSRAQSWNSLAFTSIALLMGTAALEAIAFLVLALQR
jgi:1,4-dihydroxy-2-naphthoate octaprenyltransferase